MVNMVKHAAAAAATVNEPRGIGIYLWESHKSTLLK